MELLLGTGQRRFGVRDVHLCNFTALDGTNILDSKCGLEVAFGADGRELERRVLEACVRKTVAEWEERGDVFDVISSVADEDALYEKLLSNYVVKTGKVLLLRCTRPFRHLVF